MRRPIVRGCLLIFLILLGLACVTTAFLAYQGRRTPAGTPDYVALGSSFAAGAGLGPLQKDSPLLCARSVAGYPQQLARELNLSIVDMTCGGATTSHTLNGGQFFQGSQIRVISPRTRLVTVTVGGNDVNFVGDLSLLALRNSNNLAGWLTGKLWGGPKSASERGYGKLARELLDLIHAIHERAPEARIVVATYPAILPPKGTCARLGLTSAEADLMRPVERSLAAVTSAVAKQGGAILVDMHALGAAHNACSAMPWTRGWASLIDAPFHPNLDGAEATADAIAAALRRSPAGVAAVGEDDAAGHQARGVGGEEQHH